MNRRIFAAERFWAAQAWFSLARSALAGLEAGILLVDDVGAALRSLKKRDKDCRIIRRKGRTYVINKKNPRFKARQG